MFKKIKNKIHDLYYEKLYKQISDECEKKLRIELKITHREKDRYSRLCNDLEKKIKIYDDVIENLRIKSHTLDEVYSHAEHAVKRYGQGHSEMMQIVSIVKNTKADIKSIEINNGKILKIDRRGN